MAKGNSKKKLGRNKIWRLEDLDDLRQCFEIISNEAKDTAKPLNEMMNKLKMSLKIKRNKTEIVDKLLEVGLIKDRSEILKSKKSKNKERPHWSDEDEGAESNQSTKKKSKKSKKAKDKHHSENGEAKSDLFDAESESESGSESDSDDHNSSSSNSSGSSDSEHESDKESSDLISNGKKRAKTVRNLASRESESGQEKKDQVLDKPKKKPIRNSELRRMIVGVGSDDEDNNQNNKISSSNDSN